MVYTQDFQVQSSLLKLYNVWKSSPYSLSPLLTRLFTGVEFFYSFTDFNTHENFFDIKKVQLCGYFEAQSALLHRLKILLAGFVVLLTNCVWIFLFDEGPFCPNIIGTALIIAAFSLFIAREVLYNAILNEAKARV
ncbi:MAG: hypothetical protein RMJ39_10720 [Deltaproteobacteria bacterium]|nr:hypothetical protein [Deltaproteobacteria bacterium]